MEFDDGGGVFPETLTGHRSRLQVLPTAGPLENPSTLSPFKTFLPSLGFPQVSLPEQPVPFLFLLS